MGGGGCLFYFVCANGLLLNWAAGEEGRKGRFLGEVALFFYFYFYIFTFNNKYPFG